LNRIISLLFFGVFSLVLVLNVVFVILGVYNFVVFWIVIGVVALVAFKGLPFLNRRL